MIRLILQDLNMVTMERRVSVIGFFIWLTVIPVFSGTGNDVFYNAYITNDRQLWKSALDRFRQEHIVSVSDRMRLLDYQYGYIGWCIQENEDDEAGRYIKIAEGLIAGIEKEKISSSLLCYKSALAGYRILLNRWKAPFWGPRSITYIREAMEQDKDNPFVFIQFGNIEYYKSHLSGGSGTKALNYYLKAEALIRENGTKTFQDWKYQNLLRTIAQAYAELGKTDSAILYCEKILRAEPDFVWIKNELYPALLKKRESGE